KEPGTSRPGHRPGQGDPLQPRNRLQAVNRRSRPNPPWSGGARASGQGPGPSDRDCGGGGPCGARLRRAHPVPARILQVTGSSCSSATTDAPTPNAVRILVVDDTATMRILTVRILESAGYEVGA